MTATVESIPLITASILSKKLAEGIDALVLDVKVGRGAFMKTLEDARALAHSLVRVGSLAGKKVSALLTDMDVPLGRAVGNALETAEAFEVLAGGGPPDLVECTLALGAEMLRLGGVERTPAAARKRLEAAVRDGSALRKMQAIVRAQGGDARTVEEPDRLPRAPHVVRVEAPRAGFVRDIDPMEIGLSSMALGAGRSRTDDVIDPAVGVVLHRKPGDRVAAGEPLAELHVRTRADAPAVAARVTRAFVIGRSRPAPRNLVLDTLRHR